MIRAVIWFSRSVEMVDRPTDPAGEGAVGRSDSWLSADCPDPVCCEKGGVEGCEPDGNERSAPLPISDPNLPKNAREEYFGWI